MRLGAGDRAEWTVPAADQPRLVQAVVDEVPGHGTTSWSAGGTRLGTVDHDGAPQGASPAPGALLPVTLRTPLPPAATTLTATATGESTVDAVLLRPEVTQVVYGHAALLQSAAAGPRTRHGHRAGRGAGDRARATTARAAWSAARRRPARR